jgi:hypothetical protein
MDYSLSDTDMLNYMKNRTNLIQYKDIINYDNIDDLLGIYNKCILLYHTKENYGHWTCLYRVNNTIYFFDSYGVIPDDELKFLHKDLKEELNSNHRYLTKLLYESKNNIEYNEYQLQKKSPNINTCGRWVLLRLKYPKISIDNFYKIITKNNNIISNDLLVTKIIQI